MEGLRAKGHLAAVGSVRADGKTPVAKEVAPEKGQANRWTVKIQYYAGMEFPQCRLQPVCEPNLTASKTD